VVLSAPELSMPAMPGSGFSYCAAAQTADSSNIELSRNILFMILPPHSKEARQMN
jgi:hypothetical protein